MTRAGAAFGAAGIALALCLLPAAPAHADEADDAARPRSATGDIVVTGSRIARSELIGAEPGRISPMH
jgi:hypothetical protein